VGRDAHHGGESPGDPEADPAVNVKLYNLAKSDRNDVTTEVFKSKALLVGSPTMNRGILTAVAGFLEEIKGLKFRDKKAAAFGCYGWSGEAVKTMSQRLADAGFAVVDEGIRALWNPDDGSRAACIAYGKALAAKLA
jgi:flavorubredoxin